MKKNEYLVKKNVATDKELKSMKLALTESIREKNEVSKELRESRGLMV